MGFSLNKNLCSFWQELKDCVTGLQSPLLKFLVLYVINLHCQG